MNKPEDPMKMPKWLIWSLVSKGAILVLVVLGVTLYFVLR